MNIVTSAICPVRNEQLNVVRVWQQMRPIGGKTELIFVEGGSTDKTWRLCQALDGRTNQHGVVFRAYRQQLPYKAGAVELGLDRAVGKYLIIVDADLTVDLEGLGQIFSLFNQHGPQIVATGNRLTGATKPDSFYWLNYLGNFFFRFFFSLVLRSKVLDTACGTKAFTNESWQKIQALREKEGRLDKWGDIDWLYYGQRVGLKICYKNINYSKRIFEESKLQNMKVRFLFAWQLFTVGWRILLGDISRFGLKFWQKVGFEKMAMLVGVTILFLKLFLIFLTNIYQPPFTADSWGYVDIANSFFTDSPYSVDYIRQFQFNTNLSISFPPLWPAIIAGLNAVFDSGIYAGYFANFVLSGGLILSLVSLGKKVSGSYLAGLLMATSLILNQDFILELTAARSIVLSLILMVWLINVYLVEKWQRRHLVWLGLLAGLAVMNRFDFLLPAVLLGTVLWIVQSDKRMNVGWYWALLLATISGWIIYSIENFGSFFISDNSRTILLAGKNFTLDYFPSGVSIDTIFADPIKWFLYRVLFVGSLSVVEFVKTVLENPVTRQLIRLNFGAMVLVGVIQNFKNLSWPQTFWLENHKITTKLLWLFPVFGGQLALISLTGFLDMRYSLFFLVYLQLVLIAVLSYCMSFLFNSNYSKLLWAGMVLYLLVVRVGVFLPSDIHRAIKTPWRMNSSFVSLEGIYLDVWQIIQQELESMPVILVDVNDRDKFVGPQFAVLGRVKTLETPSNLTPELLQTLVDEYQVKFIYTSDIDWLTTLQTKFTLTNTNIPRLIKLLK